MEFSASEGVLKLSPADRNKLNINTSLVDIDYLTDNCFQLSLGLIPIPAMVGYNEVRQTGTETIEHSLGAVNYT